MYIYNDFAWYGQLDVVDRALRKIHYKVEKKAWEEAFKQLEALVMVNSYCADWPMANDGDRVLRTDDLMAACLVKVLRKLKEEDKLNTETFPNLETVLKTAAGWGGSMPNAKYQIVLRGIGKWLFQNKTPEAMAREKAMVEEWINSRDEENQKMAREAIKEEEEDPDAEEDDTPWFKGGEADEDLKDRSFTISRVWKEYTAYLKEVPMIPLRGPPTWDISEWTEEEKAPFLFSNMD